MTKKKLAPMKQPRATRIIVPRFTEFTAQDLASTPLLEFVPEKPCTKHKNCMLGRWESPRAPIEFDTYDIASTSTAPPSNTRSAAVAPKDGE